MPPHIISYLWYIYCNNIQINKQLPCAAGIIIVNRISILDQEIRLLYCDRHEVYRENWEISV